MMSQTAHKTLLFSVAANPPSPPMARPISEQEERESQRLWKKVTDALRKKDQDTATEEKTRIEDMQREEASRRAEEGVQWRPRLFRPIEPHGRDSLDEENLDWIINAKV
jgi:oxysterol-binding protein-related protein 8